MSVSVNDVIHAVMAALKQNYPDIKIYGDEIKQGFQEPCFFVKVFPVEHIRELGERYLRAHSFDIHYFADSAEDQHVMAEQLYEKLEYISLLNGVCRGSNLKHEIVDGVLHFFISYDFHVLKEKVEGIKMQTLSQEGGIK